MKHNWTSCVAWCDVVAFHGSQHPIPKSTQQKLLKIWQQRCCKQTKGVGLSLRFFTLPSFSSLQAGHRAQVCESGEEKSGAQKQHSGPNGGPVASISSLKKKKQVKWHTFLVHQDMKVEYPPFFGGVFVSCMVCFLVIRKKDWGMF